MRHGSKTQTEIKIVDDEKRAYDTSAAGTRALELVLMKDRKRCKHTCARINSVFYSIWLMLLKKHGMPPKDSLNLWFLAFAMSLSFELILTTVCLIRMVYPTMHIVFSYGFPFIFVLPGLTIISPLWGIIGTIRGSPRMLKIYSDLNATLFLFNYPLTLIALQLVKEPVV